jgi:sporulation-control protein spo0M
MSDPGYFSKVALKIRNIDKQNRMWFVMRKDDLHVKSMAVLSKWRIEDMGNGSKKACRLKGSLPSLPKT